jgi:hypothetical protein
MGLLQLNVWQWLLDGARLNWIVMLLYCQIIHAGLVRRSILAARHSALLPSNASELRRTGPPTTTRLADRPPTMTDKNSVRTLKTMHTRVTKSVTKSNDVARQFAKQ